MRPAPSVMMASALQFLGPHGCASEHPERDAVIGSLDSQRKAGSLAPDIVSAVSRAHTQPMTQVRRWKASPWVQPTTRHQQEVYGSQGCAIYTRDSTQPCTAIIRLVLAAPDTRASAEPNEQGHLGDRATVPDSRTSGAGAPRPPYNRLCPATSAACGQGLCAG
jgi:hypothetical protein